MDRRPRRRPASPRARSVGQRSSAQGWHWTPPAVASLAILGLGVALFAGVIASRFLHNSGATPAASQGPIQPTAAAPAGASAGASTTGTTPPASTATASPMASASAIASIPVQCGDVLAPLDKQHVLAADCVPALVNLPATISIGPQQLTAPTLAAMQEMFAAAAKDGYPTFQVDSGYRSYQTQVEAYNGAVQQFGKDYADRTSALPGHSEHQLGTVADVCARGLCLEAFIGTPEATWVAQNSWKYGFIVSYPDGKESITGYAAEPWHVRFVGKDIAKQVHDSGLTLHEFLLKR